LQRALVGSRHFAQRFEGGAPLWNLGRSLQQSGTR
jgi:hypothetical protein